MVRRWIELRIRKVLLLLPELGLPAADRIRELKPNADAKYRKIIDIITGPHALIVAYSCIQSKLVKKEGMTDEWKIFQGGNRLLIRVNRRWFEHIAEQLRAGKYLAKQVNIPKSAKPEETRPLTMISARDQILQTAIKAAFLQAHAIRLEQRL